jgi:hypothetical protein
VKNQKLFQISLKPSPQHMQIKDDNENNSQGELLKSKPNTLTNSPALSPKSNEAVGDDPLHVRPKATGGTLHSRGNSFRKSCENSFKLLKLPSQFITFDLKLSKSNGGEIKQQTKSSEKTKKTFITQPSAPPTDHHEFFVETLGKEQRKIIRAITNSRKCRKKWVRSEPKS